MAPKLSCMSVTVLLAISFIGSRAAAEDGESGLVGWWKLDEVQDGKVADSSGKALHGSVANALRVPGVFRHALRLDQSILRIPHSEILKPAQQLTISAWVKPRDLSGFREIYRKEDGPERHLFSFQNGGAILAFGLQCFPYAVGGSYEELDVPITAGDFTDGYWHLVTANYDGVAKRVYKDSVLLGLAAASGPIATGGKADAFIGSLNGTAEFFDGAIDDVRIYARALSEEEIVALYEAAPAALRQPPEKTAAQREAAKAPVSEALRKAEMNRRYAPLRKPAVVAWEKAQLSTFLQPLDLAAMAQRTLRNYMVNNQEQLPGQPDLWVVHFLYRLLPEAKGPYYPVGGWDFGDATSRAVINWFNLREMTGDQQTGREFEEGNRRLVLAMLHSETGLCIAPDPNNVRGTRAPFRYDIWDQSRTLRALLRWYESVPADRPRLQPRIERFIAGLGRLATIRGINPQWGPYAGFASDQFTDTEPGKDFGWMNTRAGLVLEPIAQYVALTGDARSLDVAIRFANCEMGGHQGDSMPPDKKPHFQFGPNGELTGHLHTKTGMLLGLAKLGRYLCTQGRSEEGRRYLRQVRKSYDWLLATDNPKRSSRTGWVAEVPGGHNSEICCIADMIELAEALAASAEIDAEFRGWSALHDDAESMTVNTIARTQIAFTPEWEAVLATHYGDEAAAQVKRMRKLEGCWTSAFAPGDLSYGHGMDIVVGGCCQYAGMRGLHAGWRDSVTYINGELRINYFLKREAPQAALTTSLPAKGEAEIVLRQTAKVFIRVPAWLKAEQMRLAVNGRSIIPAAHAEATRCYVALGTLPTGARIDVRFPLEQRVTKEQMGGKDYIIHWLGNYVVQMEPRGRYLPFYP